MSSDRSGARKERSSADILKERSIARGIPPLVHAAATGDTAAVKVLIDAGHYPNQLHAMFATPLIMAATSGHLDIATMLLNSGKADINLTADDGKTALHEASGFGRTACVALLVNRGADINKSSLPGKATPLFQASTEGHAECVALLVKGGAVVDKADLEGSTPAMMATQGGHHACLAQLIKAGADVNRTTFDGTTCAFIASQNGASQCLIMLIEAGADVNLSPSAGVDLLVSKQGYSALDLATALGHETCVVFLKLVYLRHKKGLINEERQAELGEQVLRDARVTVPFDFGKSKSHHKSDHDKCKQPDLTVTVKTLEPNDDQRSEEQIGHQTSDQRRCANYTPLVCAALRGDAVGIRSLVERFGHDPNYIGPTNAPLYAMHAAAEVGSSSVLTALQGVGADMDKELTGATPLMVACQSGHHVCVEIILRSITDGMSLNKVNTDGSTAACLAARHGHVKCLVLLAERGADMNKYGNPKDNTYGKNIPIIAAAGNHHCLKAVINGGGNMMARTDRHGATCAHVAAQDGFISCFEVLLAFGFDFEARTAFHETVFYNSCAEMGQVKALRWLAANAKADIDACCDKGYSPAFVAAHQGWDKCIVELASLGADLKKKDNNGASPAHIAAERGHDKTILALFAAGDTNISLCDRNGRKALDLAEENKHTKCIELLKTIDQAMLLRDEIEKLVSADEIKAAAKLIGNKESAQLIHSQKTKFVRFIFKDAYDAIEEYAGRLAEEAMAELIKEEEEAGAKKKKTKKKHKKKTDNISVASVVTTAATPEAISDTSDSTFTLHGLIKHADINGCQVKRGEYNEHKDSFLVNFTDGHRAPMWVKTSNMTSKVAVDDSASLLHCHQCGKTEANLAAGEKLKKCGGCSKEAWAGHKAACRRASTKLKSL